ncbi:BAG family molecular chaperone regulator 2 [Zea mays]|uniref:BCL-2 binding anthanogene-1 n=2 Tax=Zea mays TaxID=4577 RepID=B6STZ6_MAIZE|nr:BCL-2 binding anthanogene-1 [Zea mays]ACG28329.1 BCL-2 binding anthanogene-1 [Zea mays]ACG40151.1 BCL-2 binding anthanogene-1 [Zea mays]ONM35399.1 BCL-2 binding anthanogene-1 [Zea mays]PWZ33566.1 BAG family molecular chaperone regulator 2 [Zea mays]|eukprot:NP_001152929.1 BCL-2 binding anthanogene-1 [Zea mays]
MVKIPSPRRLFRSRSRSTTIIGGGGADICAMVAEHERIEWEVRPGGMLVQKRRSTEDDAAAAVEYILVRVSTTGWQWHDVSIDATATFGDLKVMLSLATGLWPREQRLLYRGKERDDCEHLHMVGVQDKDKVLLLEDPAVKERKLRSTTLAQLMGVPCHSFIQV